MLFYNQSWAQALGFGAQPLTPEQFRQQVCEAARANRSGTDNELYGTGGWIVSTNYATALNWIYSLGGEVVGRPVSGQIYQFDTPQAREAFTYLRDLYDSNCAWISENPYPEEQFASRLGLVSTGSVHYIDLPIFVIPGSEGDAPAIRRPGRVHIIGIVICQACLPAAIGCHYIDLPIFVPPGDRRTVQSGRLLPRRLGCDEG